MQLQFLKAEYGDSILITIADESGHERNILIDGGTPATYLGSKPKKGLADLAALKIAIEEIKFKDGYIDLLILTHVDNDHIGGLLKWLENDNEALSLVKEVWFNSGKTISRHFMSEEIAENEMMVDVKSGNATSISQGVSFTSLLEDTGLLFTNILKSLTNIERFGAKFQILSPNDNALRALLTKWEKERPYSLTSVRTDYDLSLEELAKDISFSEDNDIHNGSSIAFILEYQGESFVFLADSYPSVVIESLHAMGYSREKPLKAQLVKISHHASQYNTNYKLLSLINCECFVVSTDGSRNGHPNKLTLARIINSNGGKQIPCTICFNYPELINKIFTEEDFQTYPSFQALYTGDQSNY